MEIGLGNIAVGIPSLGPWPPSGLEPRTASVLLRPSCEIVELGHGLGHCVDMIVDVWLGRNSANLFQDNKLHVYRKTIPFPPKDLYSFLLLQNWGLNFA